MKHIVIVATLALAAGVGALISLSLAQRTAQAPVTFDPLRPDPNLELLSIQPFEFTDIDGATVTEASLDGQITILDFFFTSCPFVCPPMGANMARAQESLEGTGVRFMSISVDPERDTPEAMRAYAAKHGGELDTWTFLRSDDLQQQNQMLQQGFMLPALSIDASRTIDLDDGSTMSNIAHPSSFFLIGPDGRILSIASGTVAEDVDRLAERARAAAAALAAGS